MIGYVAALFFATWAIKTWQPDGRCSSRCRSCRRCRSSASSASCGRYLVEESDEYLRDRVVTRDAGRTGLHAQHRHRLGVHGGIRASCRTSPPIGRSSCGARRWGPAQCVQGLREREAGERREQPPARAARRARLEPAAAGRRARGLAPERQRDRDRPLRPLAPPRLPDRRPVRRAIEDIFVNPAKDTPQ